MEENNKKLEIANTIIRQMCGAGKIKAMTGAKNFLALDSGVQFDFKLNPTMNRCVIKLNSMDLYDVEFYKIPSYPKKYTPKALDNYFAKIESCKTPVKAIDGVYDDMLKPIFEETTGLYLSL